MPTSARTSARTKPFCLPFDGADARKVIYVPFLDNASACEIQGFLLFGGARARETHSFHSIIMPTLTKYNGVYSSVVPTFAKRDSVHSLIVLPLANGDSVHSSIVPTPAKWDTFPCSIVPTLADFSSVHSSIVPILMFAKCDRSDPFLQ